MSDEQNEQTIYTCSDGIEITLTEKAERLSGDAKFHDYLDSRGEHKDYLTNGTLMGWQDFWAGDPASRTLKGEDQIREEVRWTRRDWEADVDSVLFFDDEEFQND